MKTPLYSFALDPDLREALRALKVRDGIPESEQIRRGIRLWLQRKGVVLKPRQPSKKGSNE